jgi:UBX domain-containing protein 1
VSFGPNELIRLVAKVNLTHTVQDLRNFIMAANPDSNSRNFVLQTTFPNKELSDGKLTVEQAGLKNAVVVQRFT